jgi:predicted nucleotidyltransferase
MTEILCDLSGKIDQERIEALSLVKNAADSLNISFFIIGATARDIILEHCYSIRSPKITLDIDLGVEVAHWQDFNRLKVSLLSTGKFFASRERHRFQFGSLFIDIIPFGPIGEEKERISWPPEQEILMSLGGFREAFENSITIRLRTSPELKIKVASLAGLAIMKIISWKEKFPERRKDAEDLLFIMQNYEGAGNLERLYDQEQDLLKEENFDIQAACIRMLGRDMAKIAEVNTLIAIRMIFGEETAEDSRYRLVIDMVRNTFDSNDRFEKVLSQVRKLKQGFNEVRVDQR